MQKMVEINGEYHLMIRVKKGWVRSKTQWTVEEFVRNADKPCISEHVLSGADLQTLFNIEMGG